jgi:crotonobetainyl-CoA:carnitine CoA-transferase CaiB-like acyl-CoA transferase
MDDAVAACLITRTRADWIEMLEPLGIPTGPINSISEALASEQTLARNMVANVDHPTAGSIPLVGIPFKMFGTAPSIRMAPPTLGQHSGEVLSEEVGLDSNAIDELVAAGITTLETT